MADNYNPADHGWITVDNGNTMEASGGTESSNSGKKSKSKTQTCKFVINYDGEFGGVTKRTNDWLVTVDGDEYAIDGDPPPYDSTAYSGEKKSVTLELTIKENEGNLENGEGIVLFCGWKNANGDTYKPGDRLTHTWASGISGTYTLTLVPIFRAEGLWIYEPDEYTNEKYYRWSYRSTDIAIPKLGNVFTRPGCTLVGWTFYGYENVARRFDGYYYYLESSPNSPMRPPFELNDDDTIDASLDNDFLSPFWLRNTHSIHYHVRNTTLVHSNEYIYGESHTMITEESTLPYDSSIRFVPEELVTGYTIASWNESPDGTGKAWIPGRTYTMNVDKDLELYAILVGNEYTVYYRDPDTPQNQYIHTSKVIYDQPFYTDRLPIPEGKECLSFVGWVADDNTVLTKYGKYYDAFIYGNDPTWTLTRDLVITRQWSPYLSFGKILFGGQYSDDYGIYIEQPPSSSWPEYRYDHEEVYGRNGDILKDMGRYKNVSLEYKISAYDYADYKSVAKKVSEWLHRETNGKYLRLEDSYEPDVYRMAIYEESNTLENILSQAGKATIIFNCKPQKFLLSGEKEISIPGNAPYTLINPTNHTSYPLIKILGKGTLTINGKEVVIYENKNQILLDAESDDAFDAAGDRVNGNIYTEDILSLKPGDNVIDYSDTDIYGVTIIPRWWRV